MISTYIYFFFLLANVPIQVENGFVRLDSISKSFVFDMRYATNNNFLKSAVYECDACLLRNEVAKALVKANDHFIAKGYRIKLFDCYRPLDVQKKMWEILPDPRYVADPFRGSIHNRGGAVDLTLVDESGTALDMGTDFDHFGKEAHHNYENLAPTIIQNRKLLKEGMEKFGFRPISTEWWHYNFRSTRNYPVSNFKTTCN